jgi:hypothetical protein
MLRDQLRRLYTRLEIRFSDELECDGCFLRLQQEPIQPGECIGVYAGTRTTVAGDYVMEIAEGVWIDGSPNTTDHVHMMARINDWFWDERQNCKLKSGGIIVATRTIVSGEQLCMSYGTTYDWDHVKYLRLRELPSLLRQLLGVMQTNVFVDEICILEQCICSATRTWRADLAGVSGLLRLLEAHVDGIDESLWHESIPSCMDDDDFLVWLERVVTCAAWQQRFPMIKYKPWQPIDWTVFQEPIRIPPARFPRRANRSIRAGKRYHTSQGTPA